MKTSKSLLNESILAFFCLIKICLLIFCVFFVCFEFSWNIHMFVSICICFSFSWIFDRDKLSNSLKLTVTMNEPSLHFCFNVLRFYFSVKSAVYFIVVIILIPDIFEVTIILLNGALYPIFLLYAFIFHHRLYQKC